jgi:hypothetical protein
MRRITSTYERQVFHTMVELGGERLAPVFPADSPTAEVFAGQASVLLRKTGGNVRGRLAVTASLATAAAEEHVDAIAFRDQERGLVGMMQREGSL